jgi:glycine hydroxymethyltransferase
MIAGKALPSPVPLFDVVTATTHKTLRGPRGGLILCKKKFATAIDKAVFPGTQGGPHMQVVAAKAVAFGEALLPSFRKYAKQTLKNAKVLEKELYAGGAYILFGGTENHMIVIDTVKNYGLTGKEAEHILEEVGITINKNVIPDDPRGPLDPSGVRIGVPAITTRGMKEKEVKEIARIIDTAWKNKSDVKIRRALRKEIHVLCKKFPLYQ